MLKPSTRTRSHVTAPGAILAVLAFALVTLVAATPISSLKLQGDANVNGNSLTNAATVSATNVYCNNLTATNGVSGPVPATNLTGTVTNVVVSPSVTSTNFVGNASALTNFPPSVLTTNSFSASVLAAGTNATNTTNGLVTGTNSRLPASVTGIRLGAGAGSADTALTIGSGLTLSGGTLSNSSSLSLGTNATSAGLTYSGGTLNLSSAPNGTNGLALFASGALPFPGQSTGSLGTDGSGNGYFNWPDGSVFVGVSSYAEIAYYPYNTELTHPILIDGYNNLCLAYGASLKDSVGYTGSAGQVLQVASGGNSVWASAFLLPIITTSAATSGTVSYTNPTGNPDETIYLSSGSTISSITIARPSGLGSTRAGQILRLVSKSAVTTLTISGGTNQAGTSPTTLAAGGSIAFQALDIGGNYARLY